jgi:hypothetical protein
MLRRMLNGKLKRAIQPLLAGVALLVCVVFPTTSLAGAASYSVGLSSGRPAFGNLVASSSGTATFVETPAGLITTADGDFDPHASSRTVTAQTITVSCNNNATCGTQNVHIVVTLGSLSTRITSASLSATMGTASLVSGTTSGTSLDFVIGPIGNGSSKNFNLGMTITIGTGGTSTTASAVYSITATGGAKDGVGTNSTQASAKIYKGLTVAWANQDLNFGAIVADPSTSGTVVLNALTLVRAKTGGVTLLKSQSTNPVLPALFTINGETGVNVTVSYTTTPLTGPGTGGLTFSSNATVVGVATLPVTNPVVVGGTVSIGAGQTPGVYSGHVTMTVSYN